MRKIRLAMLALLLLMMISFGAPKSTIEIKANMTNSSISEAYALATSPSGQHITIPLIFNSGSGLFEGSAETHEAGNYSATVFATQQIGQKKKTTNATLAGKIFVNDCDSDKACETIGYGQYTCNANGKCEACVCGIDNVCNPCCQALKIEDLDCTKNQNENSTEITFQTDASERGVLKIFAYETKPQDLEVTASTEQANSTTTNISGLRVSVPAKNTSITITLASGSKIMAVTDDLGFAKISIPKDESGTITISAANGGKGVSVQKFEIQGISKLLTAAKSAAIVTAQVAAVPAAAFGGWAIITLLANLTIIFQSLITLQVSISKAQIGKIKGAIQIILLSFFLFALRKLLGIFNQSNIAGFNFELTYALSEVMFFGVFLIGVNELNKATGQINEKAKETKEDKPKKLPLKKAAVPAAKTKQK